MACRQWVYKLEEEPGENKGEDDGGELQVAWYTTKMSTKKKAWESITKNNGLAEFRKLKRDQRCPCPKKKLEGF